ncbi:MAG: ABC transporter permease, partial [Candidatus Obscuribacterales bacterium]|nr:ABC transporter permease [Candidatus Obscuribacterales bacterium]
LEDLIGGKLFTLILKETRQILRDKQQLFLLTFPPVVQICLYGFALSPDVQDLRLGIDDECKTYKSRELCSAFVENEVFKVAKSPFNLDELMKSIEIGNIDAGIVIPPDFDRRISQGKQASVQLIIDAVDANTAGIAQGYATQMFDAFSRGLSKTPVLQPIKAETTYVYNSGLIAAWFFLPGVLGLVLTLSGTLVSTVTLVKEKDSGTLEQLLMTPADSWEILVAKVVPLLVMLNGTVLIALSIGKIMFNLPFRGNFLLYMFVSNIYIFVVIAIGIILATISKNQRQAILTSFFFNLPLIQLSGSLSPLESMPELFKTLSYLNPLRYYIQCIRNILLKGVGFDIIWPDIAVLAFAATFLLLTSAARFRKQLG